jgi:hypothetical protein
MDEQTVTTVVRIIEAVGDSWPAALVLIAGVIGFVAWKALPHLKDIKGSLEAVNHQVHNNSGKSLKDAADRADRGVEELKQMMSDHMADANVDRERLAALEGAVSALQALGGTHAPAGE